ncbi:hypothetical protein D3C87_228060 [compost metagenome]
MRFYPGGACVMTAFKDFVVTPGRSYNVDFDLDRSGIANFTVEIYTAATLSGTGTLITTLSASNGRLSYTFTPAAGQNFIRVSFKKNSGENTSFYIDNLQIRTVAAPYAAVVVMKSDYYPFGMQMPDRHSNDDKYRYGYNGMEKDKEMHGEGNSYTTEFRQYDPRLGRWLSLDPLMADYPGMSPYVAFNDNPVYYVDPLGLEGDPPAGKTLGKMIKDAAKALKDAIKKHEEKENEVEEVEVKPAENQRTSIGKGLKKKEVSIDVDIDVDPSMIIAKFVLSKLGEVGRAADKAVKGNTRFVDDYGVGSKTTSTIFGRDIGGNDWRKKDGSDYSSDDWNHFSGKYAKIEELPYLMGSIAFGAEGGGGKYKQKENLATKGKDFLEKGADHPISRMADVTEKANDAYTKKRPTSKDIYAKVWVWTSYPTSSSTREVFFKTKQEMLDKFPEAEWNDDYQQWEIGEGAPISSKRLLFY